MINDFQSRVQETVKALPGNLIIREYSPGKASISTIEAHIKKTIDQGFKPDLIIIDYVDLLRSKRSKGDRKEEIDDIYVSTKGLARELKLPIWSVSQVNRAGAKDDIIEGDKAAGSYDKIMITDVAISLSRKKEDKVSGTGRFHIMKNRYGGDGMTFGAKIDTSTGHMDIFDDYDEEGADFNPAKPVNKFSDVTNLERTQLQKAFLEIKDNL
jgi:replicative DNA helicase